MNNRVTGFACAFRKCLHAFVITGLIIFAVSEIGTSASAETSGPSSTPPTTHLEPLLSVAAPQAHLFNLTSQDITNINVNGVPMGIKITALDENNEWNPSAPVKIDAAVFISTSLSVDFANGNSWTQGVNLQSHFRDGVKNVAIWIFNAGYVISDGDGTIFQLAW